MFKLYIILHILLPPARKLGQGNIFRRVCQEFCSQGGYPSMHCRFSRPTPRGKVEGSGLDGSAGPHPGGLQAHTHGVSRPTPGGSQGKHLGAFRPTSGGVSKPTLGVLQAHTMGVLQAHTWGGIPACTEADTPPPPADSY